MTDGAFGYPIDAVVNQGIGSRRIDFKLNNRCSGRRHQSRLNVLAGRAAKSAFGINLIKDFPNDMKGRNAVRPDVAEKDPHGFTDFGFQSIIPKQSAYFSIKDDMGGGFVKPLLDIKCSDAFSGSEAKNSLCMT